ncbi:transcriptional regulator, AraC family [Sphingobacterium spiritivorum ATCC 33300]|uniref:Transcriptional regulator, AraC family n=1 Tax=Sphingobacterium spiritivorum ATCC 33300 TaxID=525372 RepID=C2FTF8_SPHSI|nr:helix-turn-helix transcriptional regulator [Sphingobacterium spiritivorum]EEI93761.1 transcriptional regulator, AraC family [Sphingobacterium spiritivorum ATCC 33300]QQS98186.1 helix-turn-helix domain-containing protein [Sphingobacterium spiritivorum]
MVTKEIFATLELKEFQFDSRSDYSLLYHGSHGKNKIEKAHKHDFFLLFLIEKGSGIHSIDFVDYPVSDFQIHILFPDQIHKWDLGEETSGYQLMISKRVFETFSTSMQFSFLLYQRHPTINLSQPLFHDLLFEFENLKRELALHPVYWDIVYSRSKLITQLVNREVERKFDDISLYRTNPILLRYHSLIDYYFKEEKTVTFYADKLNISANYLNILCKNNLQVTALYLIQTRTTLEAKRLLQSSQKTIKEITFELGFNDIPYFSNFFKGQTGVSPRQFREQL